MYFSANNEDSKIVCVLGKSSESLFGEMFSSMLSKSDVQLLLWKTGYDREATWTAESLTAEIYSEMNYLTGEISDRYS